MLLAIFGDGVKLTLSGWPAAVAVCAVCGTCIAVYAIHSRYAANDGDKAGAYMVSEKVIPIHVQSG